MRKSRAEVVVWRPRPKRERSPTTPIPPRARKMLDLPTPELPTSSALREARVARSSSIPRPSLGCRSRVGDPDRAVDRGGPLGGRLAGQVGLGEQQQRPRPRAGPRRPPAGRSSSGAAAGRPARPRSRSCRCWPPSSWSARRRCAAPGRSRAGGRVSITTRSSAIRSASTRSPGTTIAACAVALAHRGQGRLGLVLGHDPGGVAADRDHAGPAESVVAHANVARTVIVSRTVTLADPLARANVADALRGPGGPVGVLDVVERRPGAGGALRRRDQRGRPDRRPDRDRVGLRPRPQRPTSSRADEAAAMAAVGLADPELDGSRIIETYLRSDRERP